MDELHIPFESRRRSRQCRSQISFTKMMVSHDLPCSTVTNQIAFDQRDSNTIPAFKRTMDRRCQALVSKSKTLAPSLLPNWNGSWERSGQSITPCLLFTPLPLSLSWVAPAGFWSLRFCMMPSKSESSWPGKCLKFQAVLTPRKSIWAVLFWCFPPTIPADTVNSEY